MEIEEFLMMASKDDLARLISNTINIINNREFKNTNEELSIIEDALRELGRLLSSYGMDEISREEYPRITTLIMFMLYLWWTAWEEITGERDPEYVVELAVPCLKEGALDWEQYKV